MGFDYYRWAPYVPIAKRKAEAQRKIAKMQKSGKAIEPVKLTGKAVANTFWGKSWNKNLESYSDYSNRLPRGRTYLRNGFVIDLQISPGVIFAQVLGSELYKVNIKIEKLDRSKWGNIVKSCSGKINSLIELIRGDLSDNVLAIITNPEQGLFPEPNQITLRCSCPDSARMCKHVAATLYGVGAKLDEKPELFFVLRNVDSKELINEAAQKTTGLLSKEVLGDEIVVAQDLGDIFGIDIIETSPTSQNKPPVRAKKQAKKKGTKKKQELPIANTKKAKLMETLKKQKKRIGK